MRKISRTRARLTAAATAVGGIAIVATTLATMASAAPASAGTHGAGMNSAGMNSAGMNSAPAGYRFTTLDNANDPTFNQLLGINNSGEIAGYFGSGAADHPNKGYKLFPPYGQGSYANENFPGSVQTQVTGLNDQGDTVGFWSSMNNANLMNDNFGFYELNGHVFHTVQFPTGDNASPAGRPATRHQRPRRRRRVLHQRPGQQPRLHLQHPHQAVHPGPGAGLPDRHGRAEPDRGRHQQPRRHRRVLHRQERHHRRVPRLQARPFPDPRRTRARRPPRRSASTTTTRWSATYTDGTGSSATMHGFTWTPGGGFASVDDPQGQGTTTINGVNDAGDLVGFYVDATGNTDGFLATPVRRQVVHLNLMSMPQGTVSISTMSGGSDVVHVTLFGLTPGSSHTVKLHGAAIGTLTADATGQASAQFTAAQHPQRRAAEGPRRRAGHRRHRDNRTAQRRKRRHLPAARGRGGLPGRLAAGPRHARLRPVRADHHGHADRQRRQPRPARRAHPPRKLPEPGPGAVHADGLHR